MKSDRERLFDNLYNDHYVRALYFTEKLCNNRHDAEDIVHEALIKMWRWDGLITDEKKLLYILIKQVYFNQCKLKKITPYIATDIIPESEENIEYLIIRANFLDLIFKFSKSLPPKCKEIFNLMYIDGLDYNQICELLGANINTVRNQHERITRLARAYFNTKKHQKKLIWNQRTIDKINELRERMSLKNACNVLGINYKIACNLLIRL